MKVVTHGGMCCGIKTIYSMGTSPEAMVGTLAANIGGSTPFTKAAPKEDGKTRLHRYVLGLEENYPNGIIEVVVMRPQAWTGVRPKGLDTPWTHELKYSQADSWAPALEEFGFKLVNSSKNSNSKNTVFVWHRNSGGEGVSPLEPLEEYPKPTPTPKGKKAVPVCGKVGCYECGFKLVDDPDYDPDEDEEEDD